MFQVSTTASDGVGMLVFLSVGGMGMFCLVITLAFLAARLAGNKHGQDDMEGIMEAAKEDLKTLRMKEPFLSLKKETSMTLWTL